MSKLTEFQLYAQIKSSEATGRVPGGGSVRCSRCNGWMGQAGNWAVCLHCGFARMLFPEPERAENVIVMPAAAAPPLARKAAA